MRFQILKMRRQKELDIKICDGLVEGSSLGLWEDDCDIILYDTVIGEVNEDCRKEAYCKLKVQRKFVFHKPTYQIE